MGNYWLALDELEKRKPKLRTEYTANARFLTRMDLWHHEALADWASSGKPELDELTRLANELPTYLQFLQEAKDLEKRWAKSGLLDGLMNEVTPPETKEDDVTTFLRESKKAADARRYRCPTTG